jgi:hypothetical protein
MLHKLETLKDRIMLHETRFNNIHLLKIIGFLDSVHRPVF